MVIANFYSYVYNFIVIIKIPIKKITSIFYKGGITGGTK